MRKELIWAHTHAYRNNNLRKVSLQDAIVLSETFFFLYKRQLGETETEQRADT
jgi:hypothetical protein